MLRIFFVFLLLHPFLAAKASVVYVNRAATGLNNGTSWPNAFVNLNTALQQAVYGDEIWVAKGTYNAYEPNSAFSFVLKSGVRLYGGFSGNETFLSQRDWTLNKAVLMTFTLIFGDTTPFFNAVYCENTDSTTLIDGFTMRKSFADLTALGYECSDSGVNEAGCHGGGLYVYSSNPSSPSSVTVRNCAFLGNIAEYGGGVAVNFSTGAGQVRIIKCHFEGNHANTFGNGGGLFVSVGQSGQSKILIDSSIFQNNTGYSTSGVYILNANNNLDFQLTNSEFRGNKTVLTGTLTIQNYGNKKIRVEKCVFKENHSGLNQFEPGRGGALLGFNYIVGNCKFINNRAYLGGAGAVEDVQIVNCIFANNRSTKDGGALWSTGTNFLVNNTFLNNYALKTGGVISTIGSTTDTLVNCLFWNNQAGESGDFVSSSGFSKIFIDHSAVDAPDCDALKSDINSTYDTLVCGANMFFNIDPFFRDTMNGDYRLTGCSPLLDMGDSTWAARFGLLTDLAGNPRILDEAPDLGAYETKAFRAEMSKQDVKCYGQLNGVAAVMPTGGFSPYAYVWSGGQQDSVLTQLPPGVYIAMVKDADSCSDSLNINIAQPDTLQFAAEVQDASGQQVADGLVSVTSTTGGTQPYEYKWDNGNMNGMLGSLLPGFYTLTVTDVMGCAATWTFEVKYTVGTNEIEERAVLLIYPNPASGVATLEAELQEKSLPANLELYDAEGQRVRSLALKGNSGGRSVWQISLVGLAAGQYMALLHNSTGQIIGSGKLIKQ